jgi:hypothetical protein
MIPMSKAKITALRAERESAKLAPLVPRGRCPQPQKSVFASELGAKAMLKRIAQLNMNPPRGWTYNTSVRAYLCNPGCGWWHMTSKPYGTS